MLSGNHQKEGAKKKYNDSCERSKDRLSSHPFIFASMFLTKMEFFEWGGGGLKRSKLFELTVQGWLAIDRAYLSIQRSNDMFDKDQYKDAFDKV